MTWEAEVERLLAKCRAIISGAPGAYFILEALWDGDTTGWFLNIALLAVDQTAPDSNPQKHEIDSIRYGGDIRLFSGEVPPWPETRVAQELGRRVVEFAPCSLWFPSPDEPDDDNPAYVQRGLAISCVDCQKLILPPKSPFVPKDCCYHCHLRRKG